MIQDVKIHKMVDLPQERLRKKNQFVFEMINSRFQTTLASTQQLIAWDVLSVGEENLTASCLALRPKSVEIF